MLGKYSFGIGDRFTQAGLYQLQAFIDAKQQGVLVTPVWNKSYREHKTVNTNPASVRKEADDCVSKLSWDHLYLVDADHITFDTVDEFVSYSDFFTIDVANQIGKELTDSELKDFRSRFESQVGQLDVPGIEHTFEIGDEQLIEIGNKFYHACSEAGKIYKKIKTLKAGEVAIEVSMDEVEESQSPIELYFILLFLSAQGVPVNTIAPKFKGRFNKGVDYVGDLKEFESEFERDLLIIKECIKKFDLPEDLKLSVHTGSDKFSLYPIINRLIKKHDSGLHLKTAGTTWLEELIGLAESDGAGLQMAKTIYLKAYNRFEELTVPYANVISVEKSKLPSIAEIQAWSSTNFVNALRHDQTNKDYNPDFRQFLHTSYKVAAELGEDYVDQLKNNASTIGKNVRENIFERHLKPLFL